MKKLIILFVAIMATVAVKAQQIAVVSGNSTTVHSTLQAAIEAAPAGSVIYLPGGGFPISDDVKITKKLNIIGIGYWVKGDNVDGYTSILGNLWFNEGSDGSSVMGVYMTGKIYIGNDGKKVDNVLVRYNWIDGVEVHNSACMGTVVNQNYLRGESCFDFASVDFTNNIASDVQSIDNGVIAHNILTGSYHSIWATGNSSIKGNIFLYGGVNGVSGQINSNMTRWAWDEDEDLINMEGIEWSDVFVNNAGVNPKSDFHFKDNYKQYQDRVGIYSGNGFRESSQPNTPYIVAKQVDEMTDAEGKLNIKIRVRAGE